MWLKIVILIILSFIAIPPIVFDKKLKMEGTKMDIFDMIRRKYRRQRAYRPWKGPKTDERINRIVAECVVLMKEIGSPVSESICPEVRTTGTHCYYGRCCPKGSLKMYTKYNYYF